MHLLTTAPIKHLVTHYLTASCNFSAGILGAVIWEIRFFLLSVVDEVSSSVIVDNIYTELSSRVSSLAMYDVLSSCVLPILTSKSFNTGN